MVNPIAIADIAKLLTKNDPITIGETHISIRAKDIVPSVLRVGSVKIKNIFPFLFFCLFLFFQKTISDLSRDSFDSARFIPPKCFCNVIKKNSF